MKINWRKGYVGILALCLLMSVQAMAQEEIYSEPIKLKKKKSRFAVKIHENIGRKNTERKQKLTETKLAQKKIYAPLLVVTRRVRELRMCIGLWPE